MTLFVRTQLTSTSLTARAKEGPNNINTQEDILYDINSGHHFIFR